MAMEKKRKRISEGGVTVREGKLQLDQFTSEHARCVRCVDVGKNFKLFARATEGHPNLVKFFGTGSVDQTEYYIVEYGQKLPDFLSRKPSHRERRQILKGLADAVYYLYELGFGLTRLSQDDIIVLECGNGDVCAKMGCLENLKYVVTALRPEEQLQQVWQKQLHPLFKIILGEDVDEEAEDFLDRLLEDPKFAVAEVGKHPLFWNPYKKLEFLGDVSHWFSKCSGPRAQFEGTDFSTLFYKKDGWSRWLNCDIEREIMSRFKHPSKREKQIT